jgi:hypothetical protein
MTHLPIESATGRRHLVSLARIALLATGASGPGIKLAAFWVPLLR